jgi:CRP-like cAMP-binding protein
MVDLMDLRKILLLERLPDAFLQRMLPYVEAREYKDRQIVYEEGDPAENFYMLKRGKILLEVEISDTIIISLGSIKSGYSFGWSALLHGKRHTTYAVCAELCEVLSIPGARLIQILQEDYTSGYWFMKEAFRIMKWRLGRRTEQFIKVMRKHPDIRRLLGLEEGNPRGSSP